MNGIEYVMRATLTEIKKMNKNLSKSIGEEVKEQEEPILKCPYSGQIISQNLKEKIDEDIK